MIIPKGIRSDMNSLTIRPIPSFLSGPNLYQNWKGCTKRHFAKYKNPFKLNLTSGCTHILLENQNQWFCNLHNHFFVGVKSPGDPYTKKPLILTLEDHDCNDPSSFAPCYPTIMPFTLNPLQSLKKMERGPVWRDMTRTSEGRTCEWKGAIGARFRSAHLW